MPDLKIYLDQMFNLEVAQSLIKAGHDVIRASEIGQGRADSTIQHHSVKYIFYQEAKIVKRVCLLFVVFITFLGCGGHYMIGEETFSSSSKALQWQTENLSSVLNKIMPGGNPVHGTALVIFPSDVEIHNNYINYGNNSFRLGKEQIDFEIIISKNNFQFIANAIRKRGIFESVAVERHNGNPASFPIGYYDYMIFLDVDGWFVKGRDNPRGLPITMEKGKSVDAPHVLAFLDSICQQAKALSGK